MSSRAAHANMARAYWAGETHGPLMAQGATTVRVDSEDLAFTLSDDLELARVVATYRMTNTGAAIASDEVAFVFVRGEERRSLESPLASAPTVLVDGTATTVRVLEGQEEAGARDAPWTKVEHQQLGWMVFHLDFAPGQSRTVEVQYPHRPTLDLSRHVNPTFTYDYLLSPAKSWASFGPLTVTVRTPAATQLLGSTIALKRAGEVYRAELTSLPEGELTFSVSSTRGLWFGFTSPAGYFALVGGVLALLALPLPWLLGRRWRRASPLTSTLWMVSCIGALVLALAITAAATAASWAPRHAFGYGYGGALGLMFFVFVAAITGTIVAGLAARGRADSSLTQTD